MPVGATLVATAPIWAPALAGGLQALVQGRANKRNIEFQRDTIRQQREWALSDWDKVNAYNHPTQQMQRYKEAGLNPQLIYGNTNNTPSAMVRTTSSEAPRVETQGYQQGISQTSQALNNYFAMQNLKNQTKLTEAQVLRMKSESDRTQQQMNLTEAQWRDLVDKPLYDNLRTKNLMAATDQSRLLTEKQKRNMPTKQMAYERFLLENRNKRIENKLLYEQYVIAKYKNLLTEGDIEFLSELGDSPTAVKYGFEFLSMVNGNVMQRIPKRFTSHKTGKLDYNFNRNYKDRSYDRSRKFGGYNFER